jgi:predicted TIM-barrel fold metal-dependent hydrolase
VALVRQVKKLPSECFGTNITITTSGVFSHQALIDAIQTIGIDNVMFSIDYPFRGQDHGLGTHTSLVDYRTLMHA